MRFFRSRARGQAAQQAEELRDTLRVTPERDRPVHVQILGRDSLDVLTARDISATGVGVFVPHRFEGCDIFSEVELIVTLPGERAFTARGVIRHRSDAGAHSAFFGLEFLHLPDVHRQKILAYVEKRAARD